MYRPTHCRRPAVLWVSCANAKFGPDRQKGRHRRQEPQSSKFPSICGFRTAGRRQCVGLYITHQLNNMSGLTLARQIGLLARQGLWI